MRMSELSSTSGIAIATIKYYLREGLLPVGESTGVNQASYSHDHVRRLRLIRVLIDVGGISVVSARTVLDAVDDPEMSLSHVFGKAQHTVSQSDLYVRPPSESARRRVDALIARTGWRVTPENPGRIAAANVIDAFAAIGHPELSDLVEDYATAAELVARADLESVGKQPDVAAMAEVVVAGTVLGDAFFAALRRIAQEHVTAEKYVVYGPVSDAVDPRRSAARPLQE